MFLLKRNISINSPKKKEILAFNAINEAKLKKNTVVLSNGNNVEVVRINTYNN